MKLIIQILVILAIMLASILGWEKLKDYSFFNSEKVTTTHNIVIKEITSLGKMELIKYTFKDVVEQEITRNFLPDPKAILIVQGEAVGCLDLSKLKDQDVVIDGENVILNLPDPEICEHKIDHTKSKIYKTEYSFMNEELLLDEAYKKAEEQILKSAMDSDILEQTKKNAELFLKPLMQKICQKNVVIKFPLHAAIRKLK